MQAPLREVDLCMTKTSRVRLFFGEVLVAEVLPSIFFIVFDPFLNFFLVVWVRSYIHVQ